MISPELLKRMENPKFAAVLMRKIAERPQGIGLPS